MTEFSNASQPSLPQTMEMRDGKIADPDARAAAQALHRCFQVKDAEADARWPRWAQAQTPALRLAVYLLVWRWYLKESDALAKIANTR